MASEESKAKAIANRRTTRRCNRVGRRLVTRLAVATKLRRAAPESGLRPRMLEIQTWWKAAPAGLVLVCRGYMGLGSSAYLPSVGPLARVSCLRWTGLVSEPW